MRFLLRYSNSLTGGLIDMSKTKGTAGCISSNVSQYTLLIHINNVSAKFCGKIEGKHADFRCGIRRRILPGKCPESVRKVPGKCLKIKENCYLKRG